MPSVEFLKHLSKKLKTGNLRSIHLNATPGRYATRLDVFDLKKVKASLAQNFLNSLLTESKFQFKINFDHLDLNQLYDDEMTALNFVAKKLNALAIQNEDNYNEYGIKTFGFGYPLFIKKVQKNPTKVIKAPLIIWRLDIVKSSRKTNEWIISREEDQGIYFNEVLISHLESDEGVKIERIDEELLNDDLLDRHELHQIIEKVLKQFNVEQRSIVSDNLSRFPDKELITNLTGQCHGFPGVACLDFTVPKKRVLLLIWIN